MPKHIISLDKNLDRDRILTQALLKAARLLEVNQLALGEIIGESEASISRAAKGSRLIQEKSKAGELSVMLLRAFRALDAIVGGKEEALRHWFHTENRHLGGVPSELVRTVQGLSDVVGYLDSMRGKV